MVHTYSDPTQRMGRPRLSMHHCEGDRNKQEHKHRAHLCRKPQTHTHWAKAHQKVQHAHGEEKIQLLYHEASDVCEVIILTHRSWRPPIGLLCQGIRSRATTGKGKEGPGQEENGTGEPTEKRKKSFKSELPDGAKRKNMGPGVHSFPLHPLCACILP